MSTVLRVHFDQNCMNARHSDPDLERVQRLHNSGRIVLLANRQNFEELTDDEADNRFRERLHEFSTTSESARYGVSRSKYGNGVSYGPVSTRISLHGVWGLVFPERAFPDSAKATAEEWRSLHDAMHLVNAHEQGADVFLTNEKQLLDAAERLHTRLNYRPTVEKPKDLADRLEEPS